MLRASTRFLLIASFAWLATACQWHPDTVGESSIGNTVSRSELTATGATSLYDALQRTRTMYFRPRGLSSINNVPMDAILVFRGGALMGTVDVLRSLRASDVQVVRRLSAVETYHKYGRKVSVGGLELELVNP
jgi:hypothetical protein